MPGRAVLRMPAAIEHPGRLLPALLPSRARAAEDSPKVTQKVYFDIDIGGQPAGRIVVSWANARPRCRLAVLQLTCLLTTPCPLSTRVQFGLYGDLLPKTTENFRRAGPALPAALSAALPAAARRCVSPLKLTRLLPPSGCRQLCTGEAGFGYKNR